MRFSLYITLLFIIFSRYDYNTDKDFVQLKFVSATDNEPIGLLNWYAVHLTSMNNTK